MIPFLAQLVWHAPKSLPLAVGASVVILAAVLWLYPAQVRRLRWPWRWVMPGLRAAALLALAVSLLQPVGLRLRRVDERGALLVLIDRSRSMGVVDTGRSPAQLVALADGLGRLPPGLRDRNTARAVADVARLDSLLGEVQRAAVDLEYANVAGRGVEPARRRAAQAADRFADAARALVAQAVQFPRDTDLHAQLEQLGPLAASASASAGARPDARRGLGTGWVADARTRIRRARAAADAAQADADTRLYESDPEVRATADEVAGLSRLALAEQALLRPGSGVLRGPAGGMPVLGFAVDDTTAPLALSDSPGGGGLKPFLALEPQGTGSDLAGALPAALRRAGGRPVRAAVMLSDGRQVGGPGAGVVAGLTAGGVPVFAVSVAAPGPPRDLAFARVSLPDAVFVGETAMIRADLRPGLNAPAAEVRLSTGDAGADQVRRIDLREGQPASVEFSFKPEQPGARRLELSVAPVPGEATAENNRVERWVKVLPKRMRVAAFAGSAGWDFQYLRNALARAPWIDLMAQVIDPAGRLIGLTPRQILDQDVLILSDLSWQALGREQWQAVNDLVSRRGGSVILVAGQAHLPAEWHAANTDPLAAAMLPFLPERDFRPVWRVFPGEQPWFRFAPTNEARGSGTALRLGGPFDADAAAWQALPGVFRFLGIPRPKLKANTEALLVETETGLPVLTRSRFGAGQVFFLGLDETWRWRMLRSAEAYQDRFWLQLVRAAAGLPYAAERGAVALDVAKVAAAPGEAVEVRARILPERAAAAAAGTSGKSVLLPASCELRIVRNDVPFRTQPLPSARGAAGSGLYSAIVSGLPEGEYRLQLVVPPDAGAAEGPPLEVSLHVAPSAEAELADVSGDEAALRRLAESSGGEVLSIEHVNQLPERVAAVAETRSRFTELSLWDSPYLFVFVVGCLGAEWALRKRFGMA